MLNIVLRSIQVLFICSFVCTFTSGCGDSDTSGPSDNETLDLGSLVPEGETLRYVAIGHGQTAGLQSGALVRAGQQFSYPYLLAQQLKAEFEMPWIATPGLGELVSFEGSQNTWPIIRTQTVNAAAENPGLDRPYSNLGLPNSILADLADETDFIQKSQETGNPFFATILREPSFGKSLMQQVIALDPNLVTSWVGYNDALHFASSGGTRAADGSTQNPAPTEGSFFAFAYSTFIDRLTEALPNTVFITLNVPAIRDLPYFTTIAWNDLAIEDPALADSLNAKWGPSGFAFALGRNGFMAESPRFGGIKQLTQNEFVLVNVPIDSLLQAGWGTFTPIPDEYILDELEAMEATNQITTYNEAIKQAADITEKVYMFDVNALFTRIRQNGYQFGGITFTDEYRDGDVFSFDGLHLSPRGQGILTNEVLAFLEATFAARLPEVALTQLPSMTALQ